MDNQFALKGLKIFSQLNGYRFHDLEEEKELRRFASAIEDFQLIMHIIKYPTPDRVRFDIFDRVNRGGDPLNNQEMRNALYQGRSTRLLKKLAEKEEFKAATGNSISPVHMKDRYIILRAIGFYFWENGQLVRRNGEKVRYRSDIEELLGITMELSGINPAGKSSVIQALLYMIQMQKPYMQKETDSEYVVLGKFADIRNHIKGNKEILFEIFYVLAIERDHSMSNTGLNNRRSNKGGIGNYRRPLFFD